MTRLDDSVTTEFADFRTFDLRTILRRFSRKEFDFYRFDYDEQRLKLGNGGLTKKLNEKDLVFCLNRLLSD